MHNKERKAIISLAVLQTNYDNKQINGKRVGYIENFVLLCLNLIKENEYPAIRIDDIQSFSNDFTEMYGLKIPNIVLKVILTRAKKLDFLVQNERLLVPNSEKISEQLPSNRTPKEKIREINQFIQEAINFTKSQYQKVFSQKEVENALIYILSRNNTEFLYLSTYKQKSLLPDITKMPSIELEYALYKFILHIEENNNRLFEIFENICVGYMLLNSIVYANEDKTDGTLKNINIYLDTKIVLRLLGIEGVTHETNYKEMLSYIQKHADSIKLHMFDKHYDELVNILTNAQRNLEENNYEHVSHVTKFLRELGYTPSAVQVLINNLDDQLENLRIEVINNYSYKEEDNKFQIDEEELKSSILTLYGENGGNGKTNGNGIAQRIESAIETDVIILAQIIKLQKGYIAPNFSKIKNILLTNNAALAIAVRDYEKRIYHRNSSFIPSCLTDFFFFSQLWLHSSHNIDKNGDIKNILANTINSFKPDKRLIQKYLEQINVLHDSDKISDKDFTLLSSSQVTNSILEDKTMCNYENIDDKLAFEILDEINERANAKLEEEQEAHKNTHQKVVESEEKYNNLKEKLDLKIERCADITSFVVGLIIIGLLLGATLISNIFKENTPIWIVGLIAIFGVCGFSIFSMPKVKKFTKQCCIQRLCYYFHGIDE